jgi:phenylalanine-4-hydroxylase
MPAVAPSPPINRYKDVPRKADFTIDQDWASYTAEEHDRWDRLFARSRDILRDRACREFLAAMETLELSRAGIPDLARLSDRLDKITGWRVVPVTDLVPDDIFFDHLANRRFPAGAFIRPEQQLDYLEEPDIFHDVFGHVPLHAEPPFADFLQQFGALAADATSPEETERLARLFWFTVEFGLVRERGQVKVYGSGLISSHDDAANALGSRCERRPFALDAVLAQPFEIDRLQDVLFVVDDFAQLFQAVDSLRRERTRRRVG